MIRSASAPRSAARRALPLAAVAGLLVLQGCASSVPDNKWTQLPARIQHAHMQKVGSDPMKPEVLYFAGADGSVVRLPGAVATKLVMRNGVVAAVSSENTLAMGE